ncbi:MAG: hypothetical protein ACI9R3_001888 [Verrucomicrobiales bacterium]|jgi:hypothetical protein
MTPALSISITMVVALALGIHFHAKLLTTLRWRHRILWEELGKPTLMMASVDRFFRVQSFIFSRQSLTTGDKEITSSVIFLRLFVIVLVLSVIACAGWISSRFVS